MLSMNYIKDEENYYKQKIKELTEKDEYNIRRSQRQQKEIERLNNIIDELEKYLKENYVIDNPIKFKNDLLDKIRQLKEGK